MYQGCEVSPILLYDYIYLIKSVSENLRRFKEDSNEKNIFISDVLSLLIIIENATIFSRNVPGVFILMPFFIHICSLILNQRILQLMSYKMYRLLGKVLSLKVTEN
jgi:hypothetical protein